MKTCIGCGERKPLTAYNAHPTTRERRQPRCRSCQAAYNRHWREANLEKDRASARQWREANLERKREADRQYYAANRERLRASARQWAKANPDRRREHANRRRAWKKDAEGYYSEAEWQMVLDLYGGGCAYCGDAALTRDHIVPLAKGGSNHIWNMVPACWSCNASKNDSYLWDWANRPQPLT